MDLVKFRQKLATNWLVCRPLWVSQCITVQTQQLICTTTDKGYHCVTFVSDDSKLTILLSATPYGASLRRVQLHMTLTTDTGVLGIQVTHSSVTGTVVKADALNAKQRQCVIQQLDVFTTLFRETKVKSSELSKEV